MKQRVITGVILAGILIPIFFYGGLLLDITLLLFSMIATWELSRMFSRNLTNPRIVQIFQIGFSGGLFFLIRSYYQGVVPLEWAFSLIVLMVVIGSLFMVFYDQFSSKEFGNMFISVLYPAIGFSAISGLGAFDGGIYVIGFLFMTTIMTDTFAYIFGVKFGKHRLAEKISPKKSIEGSIGGTLSAIVLTMIYILVFKLEVIGNIQMSILVSILLIFVISVIGQIGDLVASKLKRDCGIKDYSNLFPGHGGVMDRFDSAIFAAMVLMLISEVVGRL